MKEPHGHKPTLRVKEEDGDPSVERVREIRVPNATLTKVGDGVVSFAYDPAGTGHAEAAAHVTAHEEAANPHPTYTTDAEADAIADGLIATHTADADAHHAVFTATEHTAIGDAAPHHARYADAEAVAAVEAEATLDLTGDVTVAAGKTLAVDHINEKSTGGAGHGVEIDGVLCKDGQLETDAIRGLRESGGQALAMGAVADTQYLKRDGVTIVGAAGGEGGGHVIQDDDVDMTARAHLSFQDGFAVTDDAAGDQTEIDVDVGIAQNKIVKVSAADVADDEFARFTATGLESLTPAEVWAALGIDSDDIAYVAGTDADWDGGDEPDNVELALDQLADRLAEGRVWVPASAMWPATDNGCSWPARRESTNSRTNVFYCGFDTAADEYAEFQVVLPVWDQGTIDVTYYWTTVAAAGTTVVWGIACQSLADDASLDTAYPADTYADADTVLAAHDVHIIADTGITVTGAGAGELVLCRIVRDTSADNCASDADLLGVLISYGRRDA